MRKVLTNVIISDMEKATEQLTDGPSLDSSIELQSRKTSFYDPKKVIARRGLERLDLLLLVIEALDLNGGEAMIWSLRNLGFESMFPNRVELWKRRCHNPLRRVARRGSLSTNETDALITLLCSMSNRLYPLLHQLLSSKEPTEINLQRWNLVEERLRDLLEERMNPRRGAVQRLLSSDQSMRTLKELILTLALSAGLGGASRLRASLLDPQP